MDEIEDFLYFDFDFVPIVDYIVDYIVAAVAVAVAVAAVDGNCRGRAVQEEEPLVLALTLED